MTTTAEILKKAKAAAPGLLTVSSKQKDDALKAMADALLWHSDEILSENKKDMDRARGTISDVMLDRLLLTTGRIQAMAEGILDVAALPDPVGRVLRETTRPGGLLIQKCSVPMGVIAIIYESRPNVTSDAAALCIKSGNACILRGGKEAFLSANAITNALRDGLAKVGLPEDLVQLVQDTTRQSSMELMTAKGYVDLLIPRGGKGLIRACVENATVNCIETGTGICHVYVDRAADQEMALNIIVNAKTSRPSVCNAEEVCVVHQDIAEEFLPKLKKRLIDERLQNLETPVELRLDERAAQILIGDEEIVLDEKTAAGAGSVSETDMMPGMSTAAFTGTVAGADMEVEIDSAPGADSEVEIDPASGTDSEKAALASVNGNIEVDSASGEDQIAEETRSETAALQGTVEELTVPAVSAGTHPMVQRLQRIRDGIAGETEKYLVPAGPEDFDTEFLDYILAVKVVDSLPDAIAHISAHSTGHSDAIITRDDAAAEQFAQSIDSAAVYVNASTRFTDGGEFGLGCEMGISTQKLHARGPMGLEELTTYKYIIRGNGNVR
ncbi:MAG: glutamate-5-semialdehyde dehydrogenase [Clostridiales bacterium]|nr:glutamate-5-semialdehyde dehydrogenase [Clostridiales bacterium]